MINPLTRLRLQHLRNPGSGLCAVCSVHPLVLQCALAAAQRHGGTVLIEATANQVNPFGGYTGMTPADFTDFLARLAHEAGLPIDRIVIGADHLGPHVWKHLPATEAMAKAALLARQCVAAGFQKLHLDTVQGCADDATAQLDVTETAARAARLCRAAESEAVRQDRSPPLYVIGNEVPPPGGALTEDDDVIVTDPDQVQVTLDAYQAAFAAQGVAAAWDRVVAVVVQPGVEFGDRRVMAYRSERAAALSNIHARLPGIMTFEVHATDYQTPTALRRLVRDHFALLKVGPCLTFALRRALYALARLEAYLTDIPSPSHLPQVMEKLMLRRPRHWQSHYQGTPETMQHLRHHSLRDRLRYYWNEPEAQAAVQRLLHNLHKPIPQSLLDRHLEGSATPCYQDDGACFDPQATLKAAVHGVLAPYLDLNLRS
ncbi:class II D-tagatose-bisphosphate aldolase non-catalytic subunit [Desulfatitalea alkaliphila]|uniref:Class II D-tagatose-bisphosphate aldolase, non-catalytic subunit n=1 Tax=Desulfatitalea alkaliphila TaxID=2929485 RepID=A0AA41QZ08_9BACT|nr:class II D-tagatose-bisphosphate aldolase, non-catalytic subunit [Desulfatitalea alkaliphila]MCJ8499042.1 class II D-tagatose-bisphosphate aldolase, non-catalytic subunit [Desulfatitalea alkaliphila]